MKLLGVLRHAKSSWDNARLADLDRPLDERGREAAKAMGRGLQRLGVDYELALISPARRTRETWTLIAEHWRCSAVIREESGLYGATAETLIEIVSGTGLETGRLLLVGHNPGLHHLAFELTKHDPSPSHAQLAAKFPTGALAEVELPIENWSGIAGADGRVVRFLRPRDLD